MLLTDSALSAAKPSRDEFLIASDVHFNPFVDALVAGLAAAPPAQWETILNRSLLTSYSQYDADTN